MLNITDISIRIVGNPEETGYLIGTEMSEYIKIVLDYLKDCKYEDRFVLMVLVDEEIVLNRLIGNKFIYFIKKETGGIYKKEVTSDKHLTCVGCVDISDDELWCLDVIDTISVNDDYFGIIING